ncbi:prenyltransferase [Halocatena pleomorpha]|uniref:Prenyltransferase n=1 Tax=Halocatena pleomorpha TaxID=1785090 RepID=A0A3P3RL03_9EURY|nr:prenyltransferase [Halocatena pleomorpha]RRJ34211.1 prenyltransferase [Halocatena pleomorpha]
MRGPRSRSTVDIGGYLPSESTRCGYLLRLSRPRFWLYLAGPVLVGCVYAAKTANDLFQPIPLALLGYFLVPANVFLYGINDIFDADIDAHNAKKTEREVRYEGSSFVVTVVLTCGLLGCAFIPILPPEASVSLIGVLVLAVEYSAPPFRFKTTPVFDSLSNGLYIIPGITAYAAITGDYPPTGAVAGGWLWAMGMHTFSAIPDIEPDRQAGIETTATVLGERGTYTYCTVCWLAASLVFAVVHPFFAVILLVYPLLAISIRRSSVSVTKAYWWFPVINTFTGLVFTLGGVWLLVFGGIHG